MPEERDPLVEVAAAVADGQPVSWQEASARVAAGDRDCVEQLRILAAIAEMHDTAYVPLSPASAAPASAAVAPLGEPLFRWGPLLPYERLGSGAFGDVYAAWEPTLARKVALKLLRGGAAPSMSIVREGQRLARIRHPNVMAVYGAQEHDGRVGMWGELLTGRTLADIVAADGPLGAAEAAVVGAAVCRALSAVHQAGLIHRDVKAQNVMREVGGRIVLMDLGLGRETSEKAAEGLELAGTPLYLAPELFEGQACSVRTDVYSVGVLLFFLVTGAYPVAAEGIADLRRAHATRVRARLLDLRTDLLPAFTEIVDRALAANPADRFESAGALQAALTGSWDPPARARASASLIVVTALVTAVVCALIFLFWQRATPPTALDPLTFSMTPSDGVVLTEGDRSVPVMSPDGRSLAFIGTNRRQDGVSRLYVWSLSKSAPEVIVGSENAANPFWSPDSQSLAYVTAKGATLHRVSVSGARSEPLADLWESRGGTWNRDGIMLIARQNSAIYRLSPGAAPAPMTTLETDEVAHMWPQFLPDGRQFIFFVQGRNDSTQGVFLASLDRPGKRKLLFAESSGLYANGYLLFANNGALFAQPLDATRGILSGAAATVLARVDSTAALRTIASVSDSGTLVYTQGKDVRRLTWYDLSGEISSAGEPVKVRNPALARDRSLLAIEWYGDWHANEAAGPGSRGRELRVQRLPGFETIARVGTPGAICPVWGPNGRLAFSDVLPGRHLDVFVADTVAGTPPSLLVKSDNDKETTDWSADGRAVAYHELRQGPSGRVYRELRVKRLDGPQYRVIDTPDGVSAHSGRFSPDGRRMAYLSDESGGVDPNIYVVDLESRVTRQVTDRGGYNPVWRANDELLFLDPGGQLFRAQVPVDPREPMPARTLIFGTSVSTPRTSLRYFDLSSDGRRVLVASPLPSSVSVVVNWPRIAGLATLSIR